MDPKSSSDNIHPIRGGRGIQEAQVWEGVDLFSVSKLTLRIPSNGAGSLR